MKAALIVILSAVFMVLVQTPVVHAEIIQRFDVTYRIADSGVVTVEEKITYDYEGAERHGIYRTITNKHPQPARSWYKRRFIDIEIESVTRDGIEEPFSISQTSNATEIKIGDADVTLTGIQTYVIRYVLTGAISHGESGAEFYYNVTGNQWAVPISLSVVTVASNHLSSKYQCYQGVVGATLACTNSFKNDNEITFTANSIQPGEGFTIATELDAAMIQEIKNESVTWILFGSGMAVVWIIGLIYLVNRFRRSAYTPTPVIAQYEPYKDYLPMHTGYLADNQLNPQDITAGIVYLAQQGFIKITYIAKSVLYIFKDTDYEITLLRPLSEVPTKFLTTVTELFFPTNTLVGTTVTLSSLKSNAAKNAEKILYLHRDIEADLIASGFYTKSVNNVQKLILNTSLLIAVVFGGLVLVPNGIFVIIAVVITTLICGAIVLFVSRRTASGFEAKNHLDGFKLFLSVTDTERFDFHNAPEKSPELFMQYLPYAIALGVEDKWAKVFEDITILQPEWFTGSSMNAFSAAAFTNELNSFSTSFSASSGVSGSSGGGSSGGGGGGGGGGSW